MVVERIGALSAVCRGCRTGRTADGSFLFAPTDHQGRAQTKERMKPGDQTYRDRQRPSWACRCNHGEFIMESSNNKTPGPSSGQQRFSRQVPHSAQTKLINQVKVRSESAMNQVFLLPADYQG